MDDDENNQDRRLMDFFPRVVNFIHALQARKAQIVLLIYTGFVIFMMYSGSSAS